MLYGRPSGEKPDGRQICRHSRQIHRHRELEAPGHRRSPRLVIFGQRADLDRVGDRPCRITAGWTRHRIDRFEHGGELRGQGRPIRPGRGHLLRCHARTRGKELAQIGTVLVRARRVGRGVRHDHFRAADRHPRVEELAEIRHAEVDDLRAQTDQHLQGGLERRGLTAVGAVQRVVAVDTDARASHALAEILERVRGRRDER
jgi:hypothetical protein